MSQQGVRVGKRKQLSEAKTWSEVVDLISFMSLIGICFRSLQIVSIRQLSRNGHETYQSQYSPLPYSCFLNFHSV
jgi:hypothetical protein